MGSKCNIYVRTCPAIRWIDGKVMHMMHFSDSIGMGAVRGRMGFLFGFETYNGCQKYVPFQNMT